MKLIIFVALAFQLANAYISINSQIPSYTVNQEIVVFYSVYDDYLDYDYIGIFPSGDCTSTNDCFIRYAYVDSVLQQNFTGNVTMEGIPTRGSFDIRYVREAGTTVVSAPAITITATASLNSSPYVRVGERIQVSVTSTAFHSIYDWVGMYRAGDCPITNDCYISFLYVPEGTSNTLYFDGIDYDSFQVDFRYIFEDNGYNVLATSSVVNITASANLTYTGNFVSQGSVIVTFYSSPYHSPYDWIGIFDDAVCTIGVDCNVYGYAYVPPGSTGTVIFPVYADPGLNVHLKYVIPSNKEVFRTSNSLVRETNGRCAVECSNSGVDCGYESDCTSCGVASPQCVPSEAPVFTIQSPDYGVNFNVLAGGLLRFSVIATGPDSPITISFGGLPIGAQITSVTNGNVTNSTFSFVPLDSMASTSYDVCFVAFSSRNVFSETRCVSVNIKGTVCYSSGDPHMTTFDGLSYDFQGVGDFFMMKKVGSSFSLQARFQQCFEDAQVTCNRGIALKVGRNTITSYFAPDPFVPEIYVNGIQMTEGNVTLLDGGFIDVEVNDLIISIPNIINVVVSGLTYIYPTLVFSIPGTNAGGIIGLCGNFDTDPENDYILANGTSLSYGSTSYDVYYEFGLSWRIPQDESFFNYSRTGESYSVVNNDSYVPAFSAPFDNQDLQNWATQLCSAGLTGAAREACLFDVAASGDLSNARAAYDAYEAQCQQSSLSTNCTFNANCPQQCNFRGICAPGNTCTCIGIYTGASCATMSATTSGGATGATGGATSTGGGENSGASFITYEFISVIIVFLSLFL